MTTKLYPLRFRPVYKDYIWGGDRIIRLYHRDQPPGVYAESWEVSDRDDGMSVVAAGPLEGQTLHEVAQAFGRDLLGSRVGADAFPLLIKLIDSRQRLSVQVHPNDESARAHGGEAKTEMWYVLDADPGAGVFAGLKPGVDAGAFREALETKRFEEILTRVPVSKGDAIFIPGGLVHAIDAGCLLLEVQQNSNTTYRIYDWGRVGSDGKPRPLHIPEALQVIRWDLGNTARVASKELEPREGAARRLLIESPYFRMERWQLRGKTNIPGDGETFQALFVAEGDVVIEWNGTSDRLPAGTSCLVPAAPADVAIAPSDRAAELLRITVP